MNKITCEVVRDLLPLYADNAVSADSRALVEEHLTGCEGCRKELANCKAEVRLPPETEASLIRMLKTRLLRKKLLLTLAAVLCTALLLSAAYCCLAFYRIALPYDQDAIRIISVENGVIRLETSPLAFITTYAEQEIETDGMVERVGYIGFSFTPMNWLVDSRLLPETGGQTDAITLFDSPYPISRIYYRMPDSVFEVGRHSFTAAANDTAPVLIWQAGGAPLLTPVQPEG